MKRSKTVAGAAISCALAGLYLALPGGSDPPSSGAPDAHVEPPPRAALSPSRSRAEDGRALGAPLGASEQATSNLLASAVGELRHALSDPERFPELFACRGARTPRCQIALSEAIRKSLVHPVRTQIIAQLSSATEDLDVESLRRLATETLSSSDDATARVPVLVLVDLAKTYLSDGDWALDSAIYSRLGSLTDVEQELLLAEYAAAPPNERSVASTVEALAISADEAPGVRRAALFALAEAGAAPEVASALTTLGCDGLADALPHAELGRALAACGTPCAGSIRSLARSAASKQRLAALVALTRAHPALRADLGRDVLQRSPPVAEQEFAERAQRRYLARTSPDRAVVLRGR